MAVAFVGAFLDLHFVWKEATRNKCHASSNRCLTSSNKEATRNKCIARKALNEGLAPGDAPGQCASPGFPGWKRRTIVVSVSPESSVVNLSPL